MIITKAQLIYEVTGWGVDDYVNHGGLPYADTRSMDWEYYADQTQYVWIDAQNIINHFIRTDDKGLRNKWMFQNELNAEQMRWLEHYWGGFSVADVKERYSDEDVYKMMQAYKIKTPEEIQQLANFIVAESIPKV